MATTAARGVLYVHSSPRALCPHVEWAAGRAIGHAVDFSWTEQPVLGIFHAQTDAAGNVVVPEDRIRAALDSAGTNVLELHRELRLALGQAWDDELEPFRHAIGSSSVTWLHRSAV